MSLYIVLLQALVAVTLAGGGCSEESSDSQCSAPTYEETRRPEAEVILLQAGLRRSTASTLSEADDFSVAEVSAPRLPSLASCADLAANKTSMSLMDVQLHLALSRFCTAGLGSLVEFSVDPRFEKNYREAVGADGWIEEAFVTYMGLRKDHDVIAAEEDLLAQSLEHFSTRPIIVTLFGDRVPLALDPIRFPKLILMRGKSASSLGKSFNYNKLTSMLFTKVKVGMVLDADQFGNRGVDVMFPRIAQETTAEYPFPMLPVHWMSRDPESEDGYACYRFNFKSAQAPKRTMRWGHAHPTWTYHALPWLAKWTSFALAPSSTDCPDWLKQEVEHGILEDEDLLNIALWADKAEKQWCKFDIASPDLFQQYVEKENSTMIMSDTKWYPKGIALIYATAHDAKDPDTSFQWLSKLWERPAQRLIAYDGKWFGNGEELRKYDPTLRCIA